MPDAVVVSVAEAVKDMLADAELSQEIDPQRSYADWERPLESDPVYCTNQLYVDVVAVTTEQKVELGTRGGFNYTVPVDIGVRKKFGPDKQDDATGRIELAEIDSLVLLVEEIWKVFTPQRLTDFEAGVWQATSILANPVRQHLRELRQFTGLVRVVFRVDEEI